jgi:hypothetical protein
MFKPKVILPLFIVLLIVAGVVQAAAPAKIWLTLEETVPVLRVGERTSLILRWGNDGDQPALNAHAQCEYYDEGRDRPKLTPIFAGGDPRDWEVVPVGQSVEGFITFVANAPGVIRGYCYIAYTDSKTGVAKKSDPARVQWRFEIVE